MLMFTAKKQYVLHFSLGLTFGKRRYNLIQTSAILFSAYSVFDCGIVSTAGIAHFVFFHLNYLAGLHVQIEID